MKTLFGILLIPVLIACGGNNRNDDDKDANAPAAIDTTQHPNGVTSGGVISTDTAAMTVDTNVRAK